MHTVVTPKPGLEAGYKVRGWAAHMVRRVHFMYQKGPGTLGTASRARYSSSLAKLVMHRGSRHTQARRGSRPGPGAQPAGRV